MLEIKLALFAWKPQISLHMLVQLHLQHRILLDKLLLCELRTEYQQVSLLQLIHDAHLRIQFLYSFTQASATLAHHMCIALWMQRPTIFKNQCTLAPQPLWRVSAPTNSPQSSPLSHLSPLLAANLESSSHSALYICHRGTWNTLTSLCLQCMPICHYILATW